MKFFLKKYNDQDLIKFFIKKKDFKYFGEIFDRYSHEVYRFVYSRMMHKELSEDITSEVFITLLKVIENYDCKSNLKNFIFGITLNKIRQSWRNNNYEIIFEENGLYDIEIDLKEDIENILYKEKYKKESIKKILNKLKPNYKKILEMKFINKNTDDEIINELNISKNYLRVLTHRALRKAIIISKEVNDD